MVKNVRLYSVRQVHSGAEEALGRRLSCTEVERYWARIRSEHIRLYGHPVQITTDNSGNWICLKC